MTILLHDAIHDFDLANRAEGKASKTLTWYAGKLAHFAAVMGNPEITNIQADHVRLYLAALRDRSIRYPGQDRQTDGHLSAHTLAGHDRALRTFFSWCVREYDLPWTASPMRKIRKPRLGETEPKAVTIDDVIKMLAICEAESSRVALRNRAILLFFTDTGCRVGGLVGLRDADLYLDNHKAVVTEKGNRARSVFLTAPTVQAIHQWLFVRPATADTVFCSMSEKSGESGKPLHIEGIHQILRRVAERAGVKGKHNPHSFRHMFAMMNLEAGNDLLTTSQLLGHTDIETTGRYLHFTDNDRARRHDKYSPVNIIIERRGV